MKRFLKACGLTLLGMMKALVGAVAFAFLLGLMVYSLMTHFLVTMIVGLLFIFFLIVMIVMESIDTKATPNGTHSSKR